MKVSPENWKKHAFHIHETVVKKWAPYSKEDRLFCALAFAGEVGEVLNLIKKDWRGDSGDRSNDLAGELADCRIYLELLAKGFSLNIPTNPWPTLPGELRVTMEGVRRSAFRLSASTGSISAMMIYFWNGNEGINIMIEIRSVYIYLDELAHAVGVDLDQACAGKITELYERWPECKASVV